MIAQGIHPGLGMAQYHAWKLKKSNLIQGPISCSMLKAFYENPYAWARTPEKEVTDAMRTGSLFDLALTDPESLTDQTIISLFTDYRTKEAREWKKSIGDKIIVTDEQLQHAINAAQQVRSHNIAGAILEGAEFQVGVVGAIGEIPAKCLIDILPSADGDYAEAIFDYKTTSNGLSDEDIRKTMGNFKLHHQAAFYRTLFNKVSPDRICDAFGFIFQDITTLEVRVVMLSDDALGLGTRAVKAAVTEFVKCAHKGIQSRYEKSMDKLDLMPYHSMNEDEQLEKEEAP
jgi:hypothetical protein